MASPKPVPSIVVFLSSSILSNFRNKFLILLSLIPRPVSLTEIYNTDLRLAISLTHVTCKTISPLSVYLAALVKIFKTICFNLPTSPFRVPGKSGEK